ncbi:MAG TPA: hypothetical protein VF765_01875 [Polyangiaceae bacterium]
MHGVVRYLAAAFACACACGGAPDPLTTAATTADGGLAESGAGGRGGGDDAGLTVTDARASDVRDDAREAAASDGSEGDAEDDAMNPSPPGNTGSSQYCCAGTAFYLCPTQAALLSCTSACTRNPSYDAVCVSNDAGSSGGSPPTPPTNACGGPFLGVPCAGGGQCYGSDQHCLQNQCYPNDVGNPCTYASDCGAANHCMGGCCQSPAKGSPCEAFWDCKSNVCTNNVCQ